MPMDFPDLKSLKPLIEFYKFRDISEGEPEDEYRNALADHVAPIDYIESQEIRHKVGWDKWSVEQEKDTLRRKGMNI